MKNNFRNKFLVCKAVGGFMENPRILYQDFRVIEAPSKKVAERMYDLIELDSMHKGRAVASVTEEGLSYYNTEAISVADGVRFKKYRPQTVFYVYKWIPSSDGSYVADFLGIFDSFNDANSVCLSLSDRYKKESEDIRFEDFSDTYKTYFSWSFYIKDRWINRIILVESPLINRFPIYI